MGIHKKFPKSPFEIAHPKYRWKPDIESSKKNIQHFNAPFVNEIRKELYEWRQYAYDGISDTSKSLLNYWFNTQHKNGFKYYFGQRESVEAVIYLYEKLSIRHNKELLKLDSWGTLTEGIIEDKWLRFVLKQATGTGKTKVLTLLIAWSYFHKKYEVDSSLSKNFLLITPNTIVLERLKLDIEGLKVFSIDPILPHKGFDNKNWQFNPKVHIQDEVTSVSDLGNIFLTNIQRFSNTGKKRNVENLMSNFLGPEPIVKTNEDSIKLKEILKDIDDLIVLNDEAHHIHEENAWKNTIADINNNFIQRGKKLPLQIDVTATPKHKRGEIFIQTISDYPLVEAIHQEVVKKPVIPDAPSRKRLKEHNSSSFSERYKDFIDLGVQTWKKQYDKHLKMDKKALLFIMIDDTKNCDDVANYLRTSYKSLKDGTFVIHTKDNSKESTGEIKENSSKGKKELEKLRALVNTVDSNNSPIKAIVSVLMLKEGWDVKNITTIVGLRKYASHILPEQTLGRGLRRMYFGENIDEELDVIGTENFIDYVKGISKDGVELEEISIGGEDIKTGGPLVIEIDNDNPNKNIDELDISIPDIPRRHGRDFLNLELLDPSKFEFDSIELKQYSEDEKTKKIIFRSALDDKEVKTIFLDTMISKNVSSVIGFFTESIAAELRLNNVGVNHFIYDSVKKFVKYFLFGKEVDLNNLNVIRNLSEPNVSHLIFILFKKEINAITLKDMGFKETIENKSISKTNPYLSSRKKHYYSPKKSVFNLISGDSKFEIEFAQSLDYFIDVKSFFKNDVQMKQGIEYVKQNGSLGIYYPDFFVKLDNGCKWIVETKGADELNAQNKFERLKVWCEDASINENESWNCIKVYQEEWNNFIEKPITFDDLIKFVNPM